MINVENKLTLVSSLQFFDRFPTWRKIPGGMLQAGAANLKFIKTIKQQT